MATQLFEQPKISFRVNVNWPLLWRRCLILVHVANTYLYSYTSCKRARYCSVTVRSYTSHLYIFIHLRRMLCELEKICAANIKKKNNCVLTRCFLLSAQKFVVVFFLVFVGFENLATQDPNSNFTPPSDEYVPTHSWMLRFAIASLAYILVGESARLHPRR